MFGAIMNQAKRGGEPVLRRVAAGFSLILLISWGAQLAGIPHYFYGETIDFNWSRFLIRTAVIVIVWVWVHVTTKRLLKRLHHLEEFLLVCSWCRKVGHEGQWLTMEEYFGSKFATETSHGICPECEQRLRATPLSATPPAKSGI